MKRIRRPRPPVGMPSGFVEFRFAPEVTLLAARWYLRYGLSYRDLEELLAEHGIDVDQESSRTKAYGPTVPRSGGPQPQPRRQFARATEVDLDGDSGAMMQPALGNPVIGVSHPSENTCSMAATDRHDELDLLLRQDNPSTHLELTMVHEATVLEYSGPDLALVELAAALRLVVLLGLWVNLFLPWGVAVTAGVETLLLGVAAFVIKVTVVGAVLAAAEVFMAKWRLFRVPELLAGSFLFGVLAVSSSCFLA